MKVEASNADFMDENHGPGTRQCMTFSLEAVSVQFMRLSKHYMALMFVTTVSATVVLVFACMMDFSVETVLVSGVFYCSEPAAWLQNGVFTVNRVS